MVYRDWIARERRIRIRLILQFHAGSAEPKLRVCGECREVLLCHEHRCPNCASERIDMERGAGEDLQAVLAARIRCWDRYRRLFEKGLRG
jgi:hypothetical protein